MPAPAVVSTGVYGATVKTEAAAVEMAATMETVPTMTAMTAMTAVATPTTMATTGRCEVWGERCGTYGNGTGKGDESFPQHGCVSSSEHRPHGLKIAPAAYADLNGLIKCV
jgi:hypothetical protein